MTVDISRRPYFDDFDEKKKFHQVLFTPSRAVQVRELNQLQSIFYDQVKKFGNNIFKDGSMVIPGQTNFDLNFNYIAVTVNAFDTVAEQLKNSAVQIIGLNGIKANILRYEEPTGSDLATFYISYLDSSDDKTASTYVVGDVIRFYLGDTAFAQATVNAVGKGSKFSVSSGVYYLGGRFVLIDDQTVMLDKYGTTPSKIVTIVYDEQVVTESDDTSLNDNAQGSTNFTAPGAHRLAVDTHLEVFDLTQLDSLPKNAVEIFRIKDGSVQNQVKTTDYNVIMNVLAQRTYEQAGDYTVKPFVLGIKKHSDVFKDGDVQKDQNTFAVVLDTGIAYVKGFRIESLSPVNLIVDRARDTDIENNLSSPVIVDSYVLVNALTVLPNTSIYQNINFLDGPGTVLGSARVRYVRKDGANYRLYLFNIRAADGSNSSAFIQGATRISSNEDLPVTATLVDSQLKGAVNNGMLFNVGVPFVKTLLNQGSTDTRYNAIRQVTTNTDSNGNVTLTTSGTTEIYAAQDDVFGLGCFTATNTMVTVSDKFSLGGSPIGKTLTYSFGAGNAGKQVRLNVIVTKQQAIQKVKTTSTVTVTGTLNPTTNLNLGIADAFQIVSITDSVGTDIIDQVLLYGNATTSKYGISYIATSSGAFQNPVTAKVKYFQHSAGDYFSVDSYVDVAYEDIPVYGGVRLTDVLDFRPRESNVGGTYTSAGAVTNDMPVPYGSISSDVEHYLNRIDKVYLNSAGIFDIKKGESALTPSEPKDPADSMILYTLQIPAYTGDITKVQAIKKNNRRYTMSDIGKIDNRVANLEYYVSLSLLDQEANSTQVTDPTTGLNRFKNGFLTDAFVDHSVADFTWSGYHASVSDDGTLRPEFSLNAIDLELSPTESSNFVVNNGIVTLPFTEQPFITQNNRSTYINVNPFAVYSWTGELKLNPSIDSWVDVNYTDPDVTYNLYNNGNLTQTWKSWELSWTGGSITTTSVSNSTRTIYGELQPDTAAATAANNNYWSKKATSANSTPPGTAWEMVQAGHVVPGGIDGVTIFQAAQYTTQEAINISTQSTTTTTTNTNVDIVNDKLVSTSVIPYMRHVDVQINGVGNRPNTKLNFFFDNESINSLISPQNGGIGESVVTDAKGNFEATFSIPDGVYRTGSRTIVATDNQSTDQVNASTYSSGVFTSTGNREVRHQTIVATRNVNSSVSTEITGMSQQTIKSKTMTNQTFYYDPLAQSFLVEQSGGAFMTKVDLFFKSKDDLIPISVSIREMSNGQPTQSVVPGSSVTLTPDLVNISDDGSVATTFHFDYPIYLGDSVEYCIVVMSNSNTYNVFCSELGGVDMGTGNYIAEQPYAGVLFMSQNASTWSADQQKDLQFILYSAEFVTNSEGSIVLHNHDLADVPLKNNAIKTTAGSNILTISQAQHNYVPGQSVIISGAVGANGIATGDLNNSHVIQSVLSPTEFTIVAQTNATVDGHIGHDAMMISNSIQASTLSPNIPIINIGNTEVNMFYRGTIGKSVDGSETLYHKNTSYLPIVNNVINGLDDPLLVTNKQDEIVSMSGNKSFDFNIRFSSDKSNLSPVIDTQGMSIIAPMFLLTSKTDMADGSNNYANYRTKINGLATSANSVKIYLDTYTPNDSKILVSMKTGNSSEELNNSAWFNVPSSVSNVIVNSSGIFTENTFALDGLNDFSLYQLMIQLKSKSATRFPACRKLRLLALGT